MSPNSLFKESKKAREDRLMARATGELNYLGDKDSISPALICDPLLVSLLASGATSKEVEGILSIDIETVLRQKASYGVLIDSVREAFENDREFPPFTKFRRNNSGKFEIAKSRGKTSKKAERILKGAEPGKLKRVQLNGIAAFKKASDNGKLGTIPCPRELNDFFAPKRRLPKSKEELEEAEKSKNPSLKYLARTRKKNGIVPEGSTQLLFEFSDSLVTIVDCMEDHIKTAPHSVRQTEPFIRMQFEKSFNPVDNCIYFSLEEFGRWTEIKDRKHLRDRLFGDLFFLRFGFYAKGEGFEGYYSPIGDYEFRRGEAKVELHNWYVNKLRGDKKNRGKRRGGVPRIYFPKVYFGIHPKYHPTSIEILADLCIFKAERVKKPFERRRIGDHLKRIHTIKTEEDLISLKEGKEEKQKRGLRFNDRVLFKWLKELLYIYSAGGITGFRIETFNGELAKEKPLTYKDFKGLYLATQLSKPTENQETPIFEFKNNWIPEIGTWN